MEQASKRKVAGTDHVTLYRVAEYDEYKVIYKGLKEDRAEAMAYYTDDLEDAKGTMNIMERDRMLSVFDADIADWKCWAERRIHATGE